MESKQYSLFLDNVIKYTSSTSVKDVKLSITETFNHHNHMEPIEISKHNNILNISVKQNPIIKNTTHMETEKSKTSTYVIDKK